MSNDFFIKFVAERRAKTGRKFETCERMKPTFAALDAAGWNDWPPTTSPNRCAHCGGNEGRVQMIATPDGSVWLHPYCKAAAGAPPEVG